MDLNATKIFKLTNKQFGNLIQLLMVVI